MFLASTVTTQLVTTRIQKIKWFSKRITYRNLLIITLIILQSIAFVLIPFAWGFGTKNYKFAYFVFPRLMCVHFIAIVMTQILAYTCIHGTYNIDRQIQFETQYWINMYFIVSMIISCLIFWLQSVNNSDDD